MGYEPMLKFSNERGAASLWKLLIIQKRRPGRAGGKRR